MGDNTLLSQKTKDVEKMSGKKEVTRVIIIRKMRFY